MLFISGTDRFRLLAIYFAAFVFYLSCAFSLIFKYSDYREFGFGSTKVCIRFEPIGFPLYIDEVTEAPITTKDLHGRSKCTILHILFYCWPRRVVDEVVRSDFNSCVAFLHLFLATYLVTTLNYQMVCTCSNRVHADETGAVTVLPKRERNFLQ